MMHENTMGTTDSVQEECITIGAWPKKTCGGEEMSRSID